MNYDSDDALDRALFALELEEPPADLRTAILASTVYRQPLDVKPWEIWSIGILAALAVWLVSVLVSGGGENFLRTVSTLSNVAWHLISAPNTLVWIAVGGGAALWLSLLSPTFMPVRVLNDKR
ncbi:MAG: hypothetical protein M3Y21_11260 [Candidatus Eremiobacteraeota bacterium]|nr:hypothetical protein [Candidatus Eremiobacteraeota bacterium]